MAVQDQLQLQPIRNAGARATPARVLRRIIAVDGGTPLGLRSGVPEFVKFGNHGSTRYWKNELTKLRVGREAI